MMTNFRVTFPLTLACAHQYAERNRERAKQKRRKHLIPECAYSRFFLLRKYASRRKGRKSGNYGRARARQERSKLSYIAIVLALVASGPNPSRAKFSPAARQRDKSVIYGSIQNRRATEQAPWIRPRVSHILKNRTISAIPLPRVCHAISARYNDKDGLETESNGIEWSGVVVCSLSHLLIILYAF